MARTATAQEKLLGTFMGACAIAYGVGTLGFPIGGELLIRMINATNFIPGLAETPEFTGGMWICLTTSLMGGITAAAIMVWRDPVAWRDMALVVAASKVVASMTAFSFLLLAPPEHRYTGYVAVISTDLPLFVATFFLWRRAAASTAA